MTIEAMKNIATAPSGFAGRPVLPAPLPAPAGARPPIARTRSTAAPRPIHKWQPRVVIAQPHAEIGRDGAGEAVAQHHQRREEQDLRPCAVLASSSAARATPTR